MKDDDYFNASRNIDRKYITIEGARENNLKNINVKIPRDKFVVVTGLSGSGKSSLAFDTIYAEGRDDTWSRCPPMRDSSLDRLEAGRREDRGTFPCNLHRSEVNEQES